MGTGTPGRARVIVIIGGGFSGTVLAAQLLRRLPPGPTRIVLVERGASVGCGVAYAPREYPYLLNVPVARMSALPEDPGHLLAFARRRSPGATADTFLPRHLYGEYLREVLQSAQAAAPSGVLFEQLRGETTAIHSMDRDGPLIVTVGTRQLLADQVVLACGYPTACPRPYAADLPEHATYVRDPYADAWCRAPDRALLLIGSGLTMVDAALAAAEFNPRVSIVAVSRHGLLPRRQADAAVRVLPTTWQLDELVGLPLRQLVRAVRDQVRHVHELGGDWRDVIGRLREMAPRLWGGLNETERRRFLRHVRIYWEVHRHRLPPATADRLADLQLAGRLSIRAGRIMQLCADGRGIVALWRPRGRYETQELWVDRVVDCSGADYRLEHTADALWKQLLGGGIATPDSTGIGLVTANHGALVDIHGRASTRLFYLGPMLRAAHWEATAVGELRVHARALAKALAETPDARVARHLHISKNGGQVTRLSQRGH